MPVIYSPGISIFWYFSMLFQAACCCAQPTFCLFFHTPHTSWHWHLKITIAAIHGLTSARWNSSTKQLAMLILHAFREKNPNPNTQPLAPLPRPGRAASAPRAGWVARAWMGQTAPSSKGGRWRRQPRGSGAQWGVRAAVRRDKERQPQPRGWPSFLLQAWGRTCRRAAWCRDWDSGKAKGYPEDTAAPRGQNIWIERINIPCFPAWLSIKINPFCNTAREGLTEKFIVQSIQEFTLY